MNQTHAQIPRVQQVACYASIGKVEWNPQNWDENWDIIGWDWKEYSIAEGSYAIFSDAVYCIVTAEGQEFLLRFIDFYDDTGATGRITYETLER